MTVAIALTVYGIETVKYVERRNQIFTVAIALTVYGIETAWCEIWDEEEEQLQ